MKFILNKRFLKIFLIILSGLVLIIIFNKLITKDLKIFDPYPKEYIETIIQDEVIDFKYSPIYEESQVLLPLDFVKKYIDPEIVWEEKTNKIIITTNDEVIRMNTNKKTAYVNDKKFQLKVNPKMVNDIVYMPIEFLQDSYGIQVNYIEKTNILIIDFKNTIKKLVTVAMKDVNIYEETNLKSKILTTVEDLTTVTNFDEENKYSIEDKKKNRWYHVKTEDGISGYIKVPDEGIYIYKDMNVDSAIIWRVNPVDILWGFEEFDGWCKVRTLEGRVGYIEKDKIEINAYKDGTYVEPDGTVVENTIIAQDNQVLLKKQAKAQTTYGSATMNVEELKKVSNGKINFAWQYVGKNIDISTYKKINGLDVISPTFFDLADNEGNVDSRANTEYIEWAKNNGYEIWALFKNDFEGLGFVGSDVTRRLTSDILNDDEKRAKAIKQVLAYAKLYELSGISLDFENMKEEDKDAYSQFVREIYPLAKEQELVLSVAVGVPYGSDYYSLCYDREALAKTADYIIVMTYDQYWASSKESGSVAQYSWVETGVKRLLKEVPAKKLLLGIPFYTRQWFEKVELDDDGKVISREKAKDSVVLTMNEARNLVKKKGITPKWDEESGQYYAEWMEDGLLNRIWLEDETSIDKKASLVHKYGLAGTAAWSIGYEREQVWTMLKNVLKKNLNYNDWLADNRGKIYKYN